jgi:hypothetical protein
VLVLWEVNSKRRDLLPGGLDAPGGNRSGLNGAKRLNGWNDWNVCSLRAGHIRQHRNKHQSQIQTSKILNSLSPFILHPFAFILL